MSTNEQTFYSAYEDYNYSPDYGKAVDDAEEMEQPFVYAQKFIPMEIKNVVNIWECILEGVCQDVDIPDVSIPKITAEQEAELNEVVQAWASKHNLFTGLWKYVGWPWKEDISDNS